MPAPSSLAEARAAAAALGAAAPVGVESVPLGACVGRTAAEDVVAGVALPRFASSAMDGWAVRAADVAGASPERPVVLSGRGEARAGRPAEGPVAAGTAARISTGARLPGGADAVVRLEETTPEGDDVAVHVAVAPGRDVRRAGEDVAPGQVVVRAGERLAPGHVAILAGIGADAVVCRRRPRVLLLLTGDELTTGGAELAEGAVHDVGGPVLRALLQAEGAEVVEVRHVGDRRAPTVDALAGADADLVVSCGGASVGTHDHVRAALRELGAREEVGGLALQPGRPTWLGALPVEHGTRPVLALPGNPGAALAVAVLLLGPLIRGMTGRGPAPVTRARVAHATHGDAGRVRALRVALGEDDDGGRVARVLEGQQPHRLASLPATDAYALVPAGAGVLHAGTTVEVVLVPRGGGDPTTVDAMTDVGAKETEPQGDRPRAPDDGTKGEAAG